jgi:hypothetical protein
MSCLVTGAIPSLVDVYCLAQPTWTSYLPPLSSVRSASEPRKRPAVVTCESSLERHMHRAPNRSSDLLSAINHRNLLRSLTRWKVDYSYLAFTALGES